MEVNKRKKETTMYIGIDLGGTNIKGGIVKADGEIIHKDMIPTGAGREYTEIIKDIAGLINRMLADTALDISDIKSIGVGNPGTCDADAGVVICASNIGFENVPMRDELSKYFSVPIFIENDANCAALGEYSVLEEKAENIVFITLGTGIGGGLILNGKLYTGKNGTAAEVGHMIIAANGNKCNCGAKGCWETYASVTALIKQTKEYIKENPDSPLAEAGSEGVTGRTAFELAKKGDVGAGKVVGKWIDYVTTGVLSIINLLQPEFLIIGGAISKEGKYLLDPIVKAQYSNTYSKIEYNTKIIAARLGNDAGLIGSAFLGKC